MSENEVINQATDEATGEELQAQETEQAVESGEKPSQEAETQAVESGGS